MRMQLVQFIVVCMPLAVLASPVELVDREAAPDAWVEVAGFSEKRADPNELFRRKCHQKSQKETILFLGHVVVRLSDTLDSTRQH